MNLQEELDKAQIELQKNCLTLKMLGIHLAFTLCERFFLSVKENLKPEIKLKND